MSGLDLEAYAKALEEQRLEEVMEAGGEELCRAYYFLVSAQQAMRDSKESLRREQQAYTEHLMKAKGVTVGMRVKTTVKRNGRQVDAFYEVTGATVYGAANLSLRGRLFRKDGSLGEISHGISAWSAA